jgi:hypothetical protein
MVGRLDVELQKAGRQPGDLRIVVGTTRLGIEPAQIERYAAAGVDELLIPYLRQSHKWLEQYLESLQPFLDAAERCN